MDESTCCTIAAFAILLTSTRVGESDRLHPELAVLRRPSALLTLDSPERERFLACPHPPKGAKSRLRDYALG